MFTPNYYKNFKCIAEKCKHSCCIGWEIDIDKESLEKYKDIKGEFGVRLKKSISDDGCFILTPDEKCPFLNDNNLCDIYINLGKDALCQICNDHPRFLNFFDGREEIGLGLCCEEAANIILKNESKVKIIALNKCEKAPTESVFLNLRQKVFDILQDRSKNILERIEILTEEFDIHFYDKSLLKWLDTYLSLEILNDAWKRILENKKHKNIETLTYSTDEKMQIAYEQILIYFVFRYMHEGYLKSNISLYLAFCILSFKMIVYLTDDSCDINKLIDISRMYSSEIEYSTDNIDDLILSIL